MALRIATAGSVDDGKSTLIGRLLHDTKTVFEDQLRAVEKASKRYGDGSTNLALLTDGLRAEREQGITIDVAYRYFGTPNRTFVVADTPGHAQYTRNMVTGASVSDIAIVLVDARAGLTEQTRRHLFIVSLLGLRRAVLAVNKMDLVGFDEEVFDGIVGSARDHVSRLPYPVEITAIPISALEGDNVVDKSANTPWYPGPALLGFLESFDIEDEGNVGARLAVQWIIRPHSDEHHDYRGLAGRLSGGGISVGDSVTVFPGGLVSTVSGLDRGGDPIDRAAAGESVSVQLADDIDVGRGDLVVVNGAQSAPLVSDTFTADICWMVETPLTEGSRWTLKHGTRSVRAIIESIDTRYDVITAARESASRLEMNDLGRVTVATTSPLAFDAYHDHRNGGSAILVDESTGMTAGALMIRKTAR